MGLNPLQKSHRDRHHLVVDSIISTFFRKKMFPRVKDPIVKAYWAQEFAALHKTDQELVVAPIQNKVGQFTTSPLMRKYLGTSSLRGVR